MPGSFERMIELVTEVFAVHNDPSQIDVDENIIQKLHQIHPSCLSEEKDQEGPLAWILMIPTTTRLMNLFIDLSISEKELLEQTNPGEPYEAIYLCSATVLPEYRKKGIAKKLCLHAIREIRAQHPIKALFVWNFSIAGALLAEQISKEVKLPLFRRPERIKE